MRVTNTQMRHALEQLARQLEAERHPSTKGVTTLLRDRKVYHDLVNYINAEPDDEPAA